MPLSAQARLDMALILKRHLLVTINSTKQEFAVELSLMCGVNLDHLDYGAFDDHLADALSDFCGEAITKLREEVEADESAQTFAEEQADKADYHSRVA